MHANNEMIRAPFSVPQESMYMKGHKTATLILQDATPRLLRPQPGNADMTGTMIGMAPVRIGTKMQ